jgi:calcineurin-like phosphoesterase family protein
VKEGTVANWFTSDHHFGHKNIIDFCQRPFVDVHYMNAYMMKWWKEKVAAEDTVYHLGDFSFEPRGAAKARLARLPGRKVLVRGNHDGSGTRMRNIGFEEVVGAKVLGDWLLIHNPNDETAVPSDWPLYKVVLCGHVHERWKTQQRGRLLFINVGVDQWGFMPVSESEINNLIATEGGLVDG